MEREKLLRGLEAVLGSSITLGAPEGAPKIDPCQLHAALMGGASGYARSANLEADEVESGESERESRQRGGRTMSETLSKMSIPGTRPVGELRKGSMCWYWDVRLGTERRVEVVSVDHSIRPPSFVVKFEDGSERETEGHRLSLEPSCLPLKIKVIHEEGDRAEDQELELTLQHNLSISQLKAIVQDKMDVPLDRQRVVFGGRLRDDTESLKQLEVAKGNTIHVTVIPAARARVFVREIDGKTHAVEVCLSSSVAALKDVVAQLKGWSSDNIVFVYGGAKLQPDAASLQSLRVQKESTVFLIFKDSGGPASTAKLALDEAVLATTWDFDFRHVDDARAKWVCEVDGSQVA
jgi:hypothetical protein